MKNKEYDHELGYVIEKALAKQLLAMELITPEQYAEVNKMLIEEYKPLIGSLREADDPAAHDNNPTESPRKEE